MAWEVLDKSAKVEWNHRFQRKADAVVQRLELQLHTGAFATTIYLLAAPLTIPLVCCHIKSFRRVFSCGEAMARRRKEERRVGIASRGI